MESSPNDHLQPATRNLRELVLLFTKLGFTAFGGPAVHVAMMEDEVVRRRGWMDRQHFLDLVAAVNFIPGPNSTELAIHIGLMRAGWRGLIVAGLCFIVPAVLIILPIGWLYVHYGTVPRVAGPLAGIRAAMIAVIAVAMVRFARTAIKGRTTLLIGIAVTAAGLAALLLKLRIPQLELILLTLSAIAGAALLRPIAPTEITAPPPPGPGTLPAMPLLGIGTLSASSQMLWLGMFFLKVGATLFGSGYVLVSYLQGGLVDTGTMSPQQLTDAIAVGQVTPGPLLTTATFIGYVLGDRWGGTPMALGGATWCTLCIFLPSFVFVAMLGRLWPKLRAARWARGALDGMNAAVVALILAVSVQLAMTALGGWWSYAIAAAALAILLMLDLNATWIVAGAALAGYLLL